MRVLEGFIMRAGLAAALLLLVAPPAVAESRVSLDGRLDTRYDYQREARNRVQQSVVLRWNADVEQIFQVVGMATSGSRYTTRWSTIYDFDDPEGGLAPPALAVRQLFVQASAWRLRAQAGAIPPYKADISRTTLAWYGWVDGGRLELDYGPGVVEVVGGRIADLETPGAFFRRGEPNFAEIEVSHGFSEVWGAELAFESLDAEPYLKGEVSAALSAWRTAAPSLTVEGLYNLDTAAPAVDVSAGGDVLACLLGRAEDRLVARLNYTWIHEEIGTRGRLSDDFDGVGHLFAVRLKGTILPEYGLSWFSRVNLSQDAPRMLGGLRIEAGG